MLAAGTSVMRVAMLFGCPRVTVHSIVKRYNQTENTIDLAGRATKAETEPLNYSHEFAPAALAGNCNF